MTKRSISLLVLCFTVFQSAGANERRVCETPLFDFLMDYTETHGTYFVVNPRARVVAILSGDETESINLAMLISILNTHGLTARINGELVYITLIPEAEASIQELGI